MQQFDSFFIWWSNAFIGNGNYTYLLKQVWKIRENTGEHIFLAGFSHSEPMCATATSHQPVPRARLCASGRLAWWYSTQNRKPILFDCHACRLSACLPMWWSCYPSMALAALLLCTANYVDCCAHSCHNDPIWKISFTNLKWKNILSWFLLIN